MDSVSALTAELASFKGLLDCRTLESLEVLLRGAVLSHGARTVTGCLMAAWAWVDKDWSAYEKLLSRSKLKMGKLARRLFLRILELLPEDAVIELAVDETLVRRYGPHVNGLGMHRDAVQSSHGKTVVTPGHKWVVLSVLVDVKGVKRAMALPLACALYTPRKPAKRNAAVRSYRKHRTTGQLASLLVRMVARWAPGRKMRVVGDGAYGTHDLAEKLQPDSQVRGLQNVTLISRFRADARLYEAPPAYRGMGRPCIKGPQLPSPGEVANDATTRWTDAEVRWYGATRKTVRFCSGTGLWYKCGKRIKKVRWVLVRDPEGKRPDEVLFATDLKLQPQQIIETYVRRWSLETTFQEARSELGLETLRNRSRTAVTRSVPMLLAVYSLITCWFVSNVEDPMSARVEMPWYKKPSVTFSDMISAARAVILDERLNRTSGADRRAFFLGQTAENSSARARQEHSGAA